MLLIIGVDLVNCMFYSKFLKKVEEKFGKSAAAGENRNRDVD